MPVVPPSPSGLGWWGKPGVLRMDSCSSGIHVVLPRRLVASYNVFHRNNPVRTMSIMHACI